MSVTLECNHCGDVAIESATGYFRDGDGAACASCGMPGHVSVDFDPSVDDDAMATWEDVQEEGVYCARPDCEECNELRAEEAAEPNSVEPKGEAGP